MWINALVYLYIRRQVGVWGAVEPRMHISLLHKFEFYPLFPAIKHESVAKTYCQIKRFCNRFLQHQVSVAGFRVLALQKGSFLQHRKVIHACFTGILPFKKGNETCLNTFTVPLRPKPQVLAGTCGHKDLV